MEICNFNAYSTIPNKSISIRPSLTPPNLSLLSLSRCPSLCAAACLSQVKLKLKLSFPMASANRWLRPEVYPLFAAVGAAVGICAFSLVRNIVINPEVRVNKEGRAAGVLENYEEGKKYAEHSLRQFVRNKSPEIMPSLNKFFADPK